MAGGFILNFVDKAVSSFIAFALYSFFFCRNERGFSNNELKSISLSLIIKPEYIFFSVAFLTLCFSFILKKIVILKFREFYEVSALKLQNGIREKEHYLCTGFDLLVYESFFLISLSLFIMQLRLNRRKNQVEILNAKSETQKVFSLDLPDGAMQSLSVLKICLGQGEVKKTLEFCDEAIIETRELIGLARMNLSDSFLTLVRQYVAIFEENYKIHINIFAASIFAQEFSSNQKYEILKILQEALINVGKHSGADRIEIKFIDSARDFFMTVSYNGCGFSASSKKNSLSHAGLKNIKERAEQIGGILKIKSESYGKKENCGTAVSFILPNFGR